MKKIAKLVFFVSISFILIYLFSAAFRFLSLWMEELRTIPIPHDFSPQFFSSFAWAIPVTLYVAILLAHSYAVRKKVSVFFSIIFIIGLSAFFTTVFSIGVNHLRMVNFSVEFAPSIHEPSGLMLSRSDTKMVLLRENDFWGPRVMSFPDRELHYQTAALTQRGLALAPALPFGDETPWFIHSIFIDINLSARQLERRFNDGFFPYFTYMLGLVLLLGSFRFLMKLGTWPFANLVLGLLAFRGLLSLETFLNSDEIQFAISSFIGNRLPIFLTTPIIFSFIGILIITITFLSYLAWGKRKKDEEFE